MTDLRQSTASQEISLGQFLDSTDGDTEENGLTIANTDIKIRKHGATTLANKNSGGATNISNGVYHATLDATDTDTAGMLEVYVHVAGALAVKSTFNVLTATAFDAMYTGTFNNLGGTAQTADHTAAIADIPTAAQIWAETTRVLTAGDNIVLAKGVGVTGFNDIQATDIVSDGTAISTTSGVVDTVTDVTNTISSDVVSISGDTLAADNLELQYDGTGLTGENFPSTQRQVANLSTGAGGISTVSDGVVITLGTETGTYTNTFAFDGIYHTLDPQVGSIDFYYEFSVGVTGIATEILWDGYVQANNDSVDLFGWDWLSSQWIQVGTLDGSNGIVPQAVSFILTNGMTGEDANAGTVRLRLLSNDADNINTDRILCEYTSLAESAFILHSGIAQGGGTNYIDLDASASGIDGFYIHSRVIIKSGTGSAQENIITDYNGTTKRAVVKDPWLVVPDVTSVFNITPAQVHSATIAGGYDNATVYIDGASGAAGTLLGVNGVTDNPSNNFPDARVIADAIGSKKFSFSGGSALSLDQAYPNFVFDIVQGQFLNLNSQDVTGSVFMRSGITGTMTASTRVNFELCGIIDATLGVCNMLEVGIGGTITLTDSARYQMHTCFENGDGSIPILDIQGDGITPTVVLMNGYEGRVDIRNITSVDIVVLSGNMHVILDSSNSGGSVTCTGDVKITNNSTIDPTFTQGVIEDINTIANTIDGKVDSVSTVTSDTNTKVTSIQNDYSTFDYTTDHVIVATNNDKTGYSIAGTKTTLDDLNDVTVSDIFTTTLTEDYSADGAEFNLTQGLYLAVQNLQDFSFAGTTQTVKKLDGSTTAATYTLDDAVTPTSKTRSS